MHAYHKAVFHKDKKNQGGTYVTADKLPAIMQQPYVGRMQNCYSRDMLPSVEVTIFCL